MKRVRNRTKEQIVADFKEIRRLIGDWGLPESTFEQPKDIQHENEEDPKISGSIYRRLFETSLEAILILDGDTGQIVDANPFIKDLIGYSLNELKGKKLLEIPELKDIPLCTISYQELHDSGYKRWSHLFLIRKDGQRISIDIFATAFQVDHSRFIQCNIRDMTEANLAAGRSQNVNEFNWETFENLPYPVLVQNADTTVRYVNHELEKLTGYTSDELLNTKAPYPYWPAEKNYGSLQLLKDHFGSFGADRVSEALLKKKNEEPFWVEVSSTTIADSKSNLQYVVSVWVDITARKKAEEVIERSAMEWKQTFDSIADLISIHDKDHRILKANKAFATAFNTTPKEVIGKHCYQLVHRTDKPPQYCPHIKTISRKRPYFTEEFEPTLDMWLQISTSPIFDEHGQVVATTHIAKNVTEVNQAHDDLHRLSAIVESSTDAIISENLGGKIITWNKAAERIFGYYEAEVIGQPTALLVPSDQTEELNELLHKIINGELIVNFETTGLRKDRSVIPISLTVSPVVTNDEIAGMSIIARDITELNKLRAQLLAQERLASIGQLVAGVAHELGNPLETITLCSELLLQRELPKDVIDDLKIINQEVQRSSDLSKNLLTLARKQPEEKVLLDTNEIIERVIALRIHEHRVNNIQVSVNLAPNLPKIQGNSSQLQQVFLNLVMNAEHSMLEAHNSGILSLTTKHTGDTVRATVIDDGAGINRDNIKKLFTPFFTTKEIGKGTGLGLSICQGIISEHGGKIYAKSVLGKGATFIVELPVSPLK